GEVMAIARSFPEVLQKAVRMVTEHPEGLSALRHEASPNELLEALKNPTDTRLYAVLEALRSGVDVDKIYEITKIDKWFLSQTRIITDTEKEIIEFAKQSQQRGTSSLQDIHKKTWQRWKAAGFGDQQIAGLYLRATQTTTTATEIRRLSLRI